MGQSYLQVNINCDQHYMLCSYTYWIEKYRSTSVFDSKVCMLHRQVENAWICSGIKVFGKRKSLPWVKLVEGVSKGLRGHIKYRIGEIIWETN